MNTVPPSPAPAWRGRLHLARWLAFPALLLVLLALYWGSLELAHHTLRQNALDKAAARATHTASAVAVQVNTMAQGLDFVLQNLIASYKDGGTARLDESVATVMQAYPDGTFLQLALADASGRIIYSSLGHAPRVSIADRPHFRAHLKGGTPRLYISAPVLGRVSHRWSLQFSRPVLQDGVFRGVLVASVSPDYISRLFGQIQAGPHDIISLLREDGTYLAQSPGNNLVQGRKVPPDRPFLRQRREASGLYAATSIVDGILRINGWQRVPGLPLVAIVGLDREDVLRPVEAQIHSARWRGLWGTLVFLSFGALVNWLLMRQVRQQHLLQTIYDIVPAGVLMVDPSGHIMEANATAHRLLLADTLAGRTLAEVCGPLMASTDGVHHLTEIARWLSLGAGQRLHGILLHQPAGPDRPARWLSLSVACAPDPRLDFVLALNNVTAQHEAQARLAESEERLTLALEGGSLALWDWDIPSGCIAFDERWSLILGRPLNHRITDVTAWKNLLHPADREAMEASIQAHFAGSDSRYEAEYRLARADGDWVWIQVRGQILRDPATGAPLRALGTALDITARKSDEAERVALQNRLEKLTSQVPGVVYQYRLHPDGRSSFPYASPGLAEVYGLAPEQVREDASPIFDVLHPADVDAVKRSIATSARTMEIWQQEYRVCHPDGVVRWVLGHAKPEREADGSVLWHGYITDITARKEAEEVLHQLATTDTLTGLQNRRSFYERANAELARTRRHPTLGGALVMVDLDHFKRINDTFGHAVGDRVLQHVAQVIQDALRAEDFAGRLGGEEFAVFLAHASESDALQFAERLRGRIAATPVILPTGPITLTASFGCSALENGDPAIDTVLARADHALYRAKSGGRNRVEASAPRAPL